MQYEGDGQTRIGFENGDSEDLLVTSLGGDLYRLEESSLLGEASYRDVIRARRLSDGSLLFQGVETRSDLIMQSWLLSEQIIASPLFCDILAQVMASGGNWEQAFGGLILIHTPQHLAEEVATRIERCGAAGK